jgi:hypothetical protein
MLYLTIVEVEVNLFGLEVADVAPEVVTLAAQRAELVY